ncbi:beta-glucosidase 18-like protein [Tanacetum coccineum]|uniref:Beta-glucosidase 18-like protein n=1 Tax=Tanacetum coccineum TaxID=301880 RepID=A0ABQ5A654_9ASTR
MPSVMSISSTIHKRRSYDDNDHMLFPTIDLRGAYYVLNLQGDLKQPERNLVEWLNKKNFEGIVGTSPTQDQLRMILKSRDIFMYIGHGSGERGSYVVLRGMEEIVSNMKIRYNNLPMYITENGYSSPDVHEQQVNELLNDVKRVEYHTTYLSSLAKSIRDGANIHGYFAWLLMDGYEWLQGYSVTF